MDLMIDKKVTKKVFDDTRVREKVEQNFHSTVYRSFSEFLDDQLIKAVNENATRNRQGEWVERSTLDRARILERKIHAQRRLERHHDEGGTMVEFVNSDKSQTFH
jgi:hypothetical protein